MSVVSPELVQLMLNWLGFLPDLTWAFQPLISVWAWTFRHSTSFHPECWLLIPSTWQSSKMDHWVFNLYLTLTILRSVGLSSCFYGACLLLLSLGVTSFAVFPCYMLQPKIMPHCFVDSFVLILCLCATCGRSNCMQNHACLDCLICDHAWTSHLACCVCVLHVADPRSNGMWTAMLGWVVLHSVFVCYM